MQIEERTNGSTVIVVKQVIYDSKIMDFFYYTDLEESMLVAVLPKCLFIFFTLYPMTFLMVR